MTASESRFDAVIAGGGIVGAACAAACARDGMAVALVERDFIGSGATTAGMGHIVVMDDSEAQFSLTRYGRSLWHELGPTLPADAEYRQIGTLWVAADEQEMAEAERRHAWLTSRGVNCRVISAKELPELEPNLCSGLAGGLLVPDDAVVVSPVAAKFLAAQAQSLGATVIVGQSVAQLADGAAVLDDGTELRALRLVNALGSEATRCTPSLPIRKRKGHLVITEPHAGFVQHQVVELGYNKSAHAGETDSVVFNVQPRVNGQICIGASRQYGCEYPEVDEPIVEALLARAREFLPALASLPIAQTRAGFRAATPDNLPIIGPDCDDATLWFATGHEGLGITTALATAELITAGFAGRSVPIPHEAYLPSRFANSHSQQHSDCSATQIEEKA